MRETVKTLWVGGELPAAQRACLRSFVLCGHGVDLFTYGKVGGVPEGVRLRDAASVVPRESVFVYGPQAGPNVGSYAGFSNLFRYAMLVREGGCWIDTDVFCIGEMPDAEVYLASEREKDGRVHATNCVMKCPAGHRLAVRCLAEATGYDGTTMQFGTTGPLLVERATRELGMRGVLLEPEVFCPVDWHRHEWLGTPGGMEAWKAVSGGIPAATRCIHLWNEMYRLSHGSIPWPGEAGSVIAALAVRMEEWERRAAVERENRAAARVGRELVSGLRRCRAAITGWMGAGATGV